MTRLQPPPDRLPPAPASIPDSPARRRWLRRAGFTASALGFGSLSHLQLAASPAVADDYRALVCVFLYGGNDGLNMLVPLEDNQAAAYHAARGAAALPASALLPLPGAPHGLHPAMAALRPAWGGRRLASVFGVGPLAAPPAADGTAPAPAQRPAHLLSHVDQQVLWESASADVQARTGWGGRAAERLRTAQPVISCAGTTRFGAGADGPGLAVPGPGADFAAFGLRDADRAIEPLRLRRAAIDALYAPGQSGDLAEAQAAVQRQAFAVAERLGPTVRRRPGESADLAAIDAAFTHALATSPPGGLAPQLYQIAKLLLLQTDRPGQRQIYSARLDGFDTHAQQVQTGDPTRGRHAELLGELARALAAFDEAMQRVGLAERVTLFTQSEFGRTLQVNGSGGTDHGWSGVQWVLGGAVRGGRAWGDHPALRAGAPHDLDAGQPQPCGRFVPTCSVQAYAGVLLRWFGAAPADLDALLPDAAGVAAPAFLQAG